MKKRKPREFWMLVYPGAGPMLTFQSKKSAKACCGPLDYVIRVREVMPRKRKKR